MTNIDSIKLNWILSLRWVAVTFQLILVYPALKFGYLAPEDLSWYLLAIALLTVINLKVVWKRIIPLYQNVTPQIIIDLIFFTILILLTGKMENPFWPMLYFHAALAAVLLPPKSDYIFLPFLFGSIAIVHASSVQYYSSIVLILVPQWIVLIAIWFLSRQISIYLNKQKQQINDFNAKELKNQKLKSIASLSSGILHEIGTPLNTIRLKTDRLIHKGTTAIGPQDIKAIDLSLKNIEDVVDQLNKAQYESVNELATPIAIDTYIQKSSHSV
jgi:signal transduction histidine kinase